MKAISTLAFVAFFISSASAQKVSKPVLLWQRSIETNKSEGTSFFEMDEIGNSYIFHKGYYDSIFYFNRFDRSGKESLNDSLYFPGLVDFKYSDNGFLIVENQSIIKLSADLKHTQWTFSSPECLNYSIYSGKNANWITALYGGKSLFGGKEMRDQRSNNPLAIYSLDKKGKLSTASLVDFNGDALGVYTEEDSLQNVMINVNTVILRGPDHHDINLYYTKKDGEVLWSKHFMGGGQLTHLWSNALLVNRGYCIMSGIMDDTINFETDAKPDTSFQLNSAFLLTMKYTPGSYEFEGLQKTSVEGFSDYPTLMLAPYGKDEMVIANDSTLRVEDLEGKLISSYDFKLSEPGFLKKMQYSSYDQSLYLFYTGEKYWAYKLILVKLKLQ